MKEADKIYVLDTGSSDKTVDILKELGVTVKQEFLKPFRFDVARNKSLEMIDDDMDICVCTDIDEVFEEGWRKKLEEAFKPGVTRVAYTYNWSLDEKNRPVVSFYLDNAHLNKMYKWTHPVHEVLTCLGKENRVIREDIVLDHYPDSTKSRSSYLPLLEMSVKEDPEDDRNTHYLGREYMYYKMWNKAIETLKRHLSLKKATWKDERCASMRFIGRCYKNLGKRKEALKWYLKALDEAPHLKEPYGEIGLYYYEDEDYETALDYFLKALKIDKGYKSYITEYFCTDFYLDDLISVCLYNLGRYKDALVYVDLALEIEEDERILNNKRLILKKLKS